jgi:hypothetical protein
MRLASLLLLYGALTGTLAAVLAPGEAQAYPWMIRHGYANCAACHVDPSGAGLLTQYGRAQSELLLATQYRKRAEDQEVSPYTAFALGAVDLPEWLNLGLSFRGAYLSTRAGEVRDSRWLHMVTDLRGAASLGPLRAGASVGFLHLRGLPAALTSREQNNLVSREHWVGLADPDETLLLRVGRVNLPFGLRNPEHTTWVREQTRTDINEDQQHGVALAYNSEKLRAELMAIAGNLQLSPSDYRERGYAGYVELALTKKAAVGVSSLMTRARYDVTTQQPFSVRQAHGLFGRWSPQRHLVLLAEVDFLAQRPQGEDASTGYTSLLQADLELIQGVHVLLAGETLRQRGATSLGAWVSLDWFIGPHAELRLDVNPRRLGVPGGESLNVLLLLAQLHLTL